MSQNISSRTDSAIVCPEIAEKLLSSIDQVYGLPGTLEVEDRMEGNLLVCAVSAGKVWYEYEGSPDVLTRTRVVERWKIDNDGVRDGTGAVKIWLQHVFPGAPLRELFGMSTEDKNLLYMNGISDSWTTTLTEIYFQPDDIIAGFISRKEVNNHPFLASNVDEQDKKGLLMAFSLLQPDLEDNYLRSRLTNYDVEFLAKELLEFIDAEHELAAQRGA